MKSLLVAFTLILMILLMGCSTSEKGIPTKYLADEEGTYKVYVLSKDELSDAFHNKVTEVIEGHAEVSYKGWHEPNSKVFKAFKEYFKQKTGVELVEEHPKVVLVDEKDIKLITSETHELGQFFLPYQLIVLTDEPFGKLDLDWIGDTEKVPRIKVPMDEDVFKQLDFKKNPTFILTGTKGHVDYKTMNVVFRTNDIEELQKYIEEH
jgi:hypothetical protein